MFKSGLQAVRSESNSAGFKPVKKFLVVLVDGLGAEQILAREGHAPFLAAAVKAGSVSHGSFPSTTSANIASLATGLTPGQHGIIGHMVQDRRHQTRLNLLTGWNAETDPLVWQPNQTVTEMAFELGVPAYVIGPEEYRSTGFTLATMRGGEYVAAESWADRFSAVRQVLSKPESSISYLYIPELDKFGHRNGWQSSGWAALLEDLDLTLRTFIAKVPSDVGIVITADHGMVDTENDRKLFLDDQLEIGGALDFFGGDTRASYVYLKDPKAAAQVVENLAPIANFVSPVLLDGTSSGKLYGELSAEANDRMPDLILFAKSNYTLFHSQHSKKRSSEMFAHHGGLSSAETRIPLIRLGI